MTMTETFQWYLVAEESLFPLRQGKRVHFREYDIAVFNLGNGFKAVDNACPHKQGPLADGMVSGDSVFCPLHALKIDLGSGCALSGGEGCVTSYPVKVMDGKVYVAFENGTLRDCG